MLRRRYKLRGVAYHFRNGNLCAEKSGGRRSWYFYASREGVVLRGTSKAAGSIAWRADAVCAAMQRVWRSEKAIFSAGIFIASADVGSRAKYMCAISGARRDYFVRHLVAERRPRTAIVERNRPAASACCRSAGNADLVCILGDFARARVRRGMRAESRRHHRGESASFAAFGDAGGRLSTERAREARR